MSKFSEALKKISAASQQAAAPSEQPAAPVSPSVPHLEMEAEKGNRRGSTRYECLIPGYAVVFFDNDVWIGHGSVINVSEKGMLFQFQKSFLKEHGLSNSATIQARLYLGDPPAGEGIDVEGKVAHMSLGTVTRFGVEFKSALPDILKSFL